MPNSSDAATLPKNRQPERSTAASGWTMGVAWLTVILGGGLLMGNVLELGGVEPESKEWTAWLLAVLLLVYGISIGRGRGPEDESAGVRLPRWPLAALPLVLWLGYAWMQDQQTPWESRDAFFLGAQAWLLAWVVAATPGGRILSWAWLLVVGLAAMLALVAALCWQRGDTLWLPMDRLLPDDWRGRWSGTLPSPGAFGGLTLLAGSPLLVIAFSRRLAIHFRILCGYAGLMFLFGALFSFSLGAWLGLGFVLLMLPLVVGHSVRWRQIGWGLGIVVFVVIAVGLQIAGRSGINSTGWLARLQAGEPPASQAWAALVHSLHNNPWLGGEGAPMPALMNAGPAAGPASGWRYGLGDWGDLATTWGVLGVGVSGLAFGGFLVAAWVGWAKLPFLVLVGATGGSSTSKIKKHSPTQRSHTPETKILLGGVGLGLSAVGIAMLAARMLNVPAVTLSFAVMAGVLARNVPQRGGSLRLQPATRWLLGVAPALLAAFWLFAKVAPAANAEYKSERAGRELDRLAIQPFLLQGNPELLTEAETNLREAIAIDPDCEPAWRDMAWVSLDQTDVDPVQFNQFAQQAEDAARRAVELAPQAAGPQVARGLAFLLNNHVDKAESCLRQALDAAPWDVHVQYYAVAVLALDPDSRPMAIKLVEAAQANPAAAPESVHRLESALQWGEQSTIPLEGMRQRTLPPSFRPQPPWPPSGGLPIVEQPPPEIAPTPSATPRKSTGS